MAQGSLLRGVPSPVVAGLVLLVLVGSSRAGADLPVAASPAAQQPAVAGAGAAARVVVAPPRVTARTRRTVVRWLSGGLLREVVEVAPVARSGPLALVVVLHGRRQTPWVAERVEGWDAEAATGRAVIAYGAGYAGSWDAGSCCGLAQRGHVDDISYLRQLVGREEARQPIDRRRVYVVGFSNGGMLALAFACTHSELVSAVATVGASLQLPSCRPTRAVSVLDVAGGRDRVVPYAGSSYSPFAGAPTTSVPASMSPWRAVDAGTREAVVVVRLPRLGHDWPTRATAGWDGTTHLWWFLRVHARPTS